MLPCVAGRIGASPVDGPVVIAAGLRSSLVGSLVGAWTLLLLSHSCNKTGYVKICLSAALCCLPFLVGCWPSAIVVGDLLSIWSVSRLSVFLWRELCRFV